MSSTNALRAFHIATDVSFTQRLAYCYLVVASIACRPLQPSVETSSI